MRYSLFIVKGIAAIFLILIYPLSAFTSVLPDTVHIKAVTVTATKKKFAHNTGATTSGVDSIGMIKSVTGNLSELILQNTPIFIKEYGRGAMATASFRGTAPSHTQVIWNGINLNSPMLGMVDFSTIPVYFTDQVTLFHGSGSLTENSGALGGIVKLQNNPDFTNRFSGRALSGYGSYNTFDKYFQINAGNSRIQSKTKWYFNKSENAYSFINKFNADINPENGDYIYYRIKNENAEYKNTGILQEFYLRATEKDIFSFRYWYQNNNRSLPRLLTNESGSNSNINRQKEYAHRATAEWKRYLQNGYISYNSGLNIQDMAYQLKTIVFGAEEQLAVNSESRSASWFNKFRFNIALKEGISLAAGLDADIHDVYSFNSSYNSEKTGYKRKRSEKGYFLQLSKDLGSKVSASLIGRQKFIEGESTPLIPSIGFEFRPFEEREFFLKSNIGKNYHEPSLNDLYFVPGGNPDLRPEEGIMADIGSGYAVKKGNTSFELYLNGYLSRIRNWIIWLPNPQGYWEPFNLKDVQSNGFELKSSFSGTLSILKYRMNGNYAYTRSINRDEPINWADESIGKQLPYIPVHSANILTDISAYGFYLTWNWNYYSKRYTTTSTDKKSTFDIIYPYLMNNLHVGKKFIVEKKEIDIELKIMNLFDEDYRTVLQLPMPGRNYSVILKIDF